MYNIEFYETLDGKLPVMEFLDNLPNKLNAKATREINKAIKYKEDYEGRS